MLKIGEVTVKYDLSHRTLRYWEEAGLIQSVRTESGYRNYDDNNLKRIEQALILRKLDVPLSDIERIFCSESLEVAIQVLQKQLQRVQRQSETLKTISLVLEYLVGLLKSQKKLEAMFDSFDVTQTESLQDLRLLFENAFQKETLKLENNDVLVRNDLRIVNLPRLHVASVSCSEENPEDGAWNPIRQLIKDYKLDKEPGFRNFGYGYNREDGVYVYTVWVTIPSTMKVPKPFEKVEFSGGLYAALPTTLFNIGERWNELFAMVNETDRYLADEDSLREHYCLEEVLDLDAFFKIDALPSNRQLDLLLPIKKVEKKAAFETGSAFIQPEILTIPEVLLCGGIYPFKDPAKPSRTLIPWYKLAQSLYKIGKEINDNMIKGSDTYALLYGNPQDQIPLSYNLEKGKVENVFAAVNVKGPFSSYPDGLELKVLKSQKCLKFSLGFNPNEAEVKKIDCKPLYSSAAKYVAENACKVEPNWFLLREYRFDGRKVNQIELYLFLK
jgi:DNA-binding transcriptional MerR regulator